MGGVKRERDEEEIKAEEEEAAKRLILTQYAHCFTIADIWRFASAGGGE